MSKRGEFNKTIIAFTLVGYEIGYSQLGAMRLVGYLPSQSHLISTTRLNFHNFGSPGHQAYTRLEIEPNTTYSPGYPIDENR